MAGRDYRIGILLSLQDRMTARLDRMDRRATQLERTLTRINSRRINPTVTIRDQATAKLNSLNNKISAMSGRSISIGLGVAGAAGVAGAILETKNAVNLASNQEQAMIGFETMLGSAEKAQNMLKKLSDFANKTPFELPQLRDATKRMLAFGFAAKDIMPTLKSVGDAAAGLGMSGDDLNDIFYALGQIKTAGRVSAQDMMQLTTRGIPAWEILAEKMGKTVAEVRKMAELNDIDNIQALNWLIEGMGKRYPDMMAKQSRTLRGLWSTVKDVFNNRLLEGFGEGIARAILPRLEKMADFLMNNERGVSRLRQQFMDFGYRSAEAVMRAGEALADFLSDKEFTRLNWDQKVTFLADRAVQSLSDWMAGDGGKKLQALGIQAASVMGEAWLTGLSQMLKGGVKSIFSGNVVGGSSLLLFAMSVMGGSKLLKGARWMFGAGRGAAAGASLGGAAGAGAAGVAAGAGISRFGRVMNFMSRIAPFAFNPGWMMRTYRNIPGYRAVRSEYGVQAANSAFSHTAARVVPGLDALALKFASVGKTAGKLTRFLGPLLIALDFRKFTREGASNLEAAFVAIENFLTLGGAEWVINKEKKIKGHMGEGKFKKKLGEMNYDVAYLTSPEFRALVRYQQRNLKLGPGSLNAFDQENISRAKVIQSDYAFLNRFSNNKEVTSGADFRRMDRIGTKNSIKIDGTVPVMIKNKQTIPNITVVQHVNIKNTEANEIARETVNGIKQALAAILK